MTVTAITPPGSVPFSQTRAAVLIAVIYQRRPTVRSVAEYAGVNVQTAHRHLERLRDVGLIAWEPEAAGTLHPLVSVHPVAGTSS